MFCHSCGTQVSSDVQFCPTCGQSLARRADGTASSPFVAPPRRARQRRAGGSARVGSWSKRIWATISDRPRLRAAQRSAADPGAADRRLPHFHHEKADGPQAEFADLFKGFNFFVPTLVASLVIGLFVSFGGRSCASFPGLVVAAMYKFTYLFIVDKKMDFWPAMQASHAVREKRLFRFHDVPDC